MINPCLCDPLLSHMVDLLSPTCHVGITHSPLMKHYGVHDSLGKPILEVKMSIERGNGIICQITKKLYPFVVRALNNIYKSFKCLMSLC